VSGNNTLQRATAALSGVGTGNWVMQMAVFRAASWGLANGSPVFSGGSFVSNRGNYTGSSVNDISTVFLDGFTETTWGYPSAPASPFSNALSIGSITASNATVLGVAGISTRVTSLCDANGSLYNPHGSPRDHCNTDGGYFVANANCCSSGTGAAVWGINPIAFDNPGVVGAQIQGGEFDVGINGSPAFVRGIAIIGTGQGTGTPPTAPIGLEVTGVLPGGLSAFNRGIQVDDGSSSAYALEIGATTTGTPNSPSQPLVFSRLGNCTLPCTLPRYTDETINADAAGDLAVNTAGGENFILGTSSLTHFNFGFSKGQHITTHAANNDLAGTCPSSSCTCTGTTSCSVSFTTNYVNTPVCTPAPTSNVGTWYISSPPSNSGFTIT
jgi:hypothetical protein